MHIYVLIVTYNRIEKLKKCLQAFKNQSYLPQKIIVVDNCSTDGTIEYLEEWKNNIDNFEKKVIHLDRNYGGSGGFYKGMKEIQNDSFDWLWISDDDAYPKLNAFESLVNKMRTINGYDVFCSSVITSEGIDISHRKIIMDDSDYLGTAADKANYSLEHFDINIFSFVGACISNKVIEQCGLPMKDYFIWFDDTEYSLRVNAKFKIMCVPAIEVFHDTIIEKEWRYSWKTYYGERNKLYTLKKHLSKAEFKSFICHYRLGMIKHFFTDHKYYLSQKDGYKDFKKGITGVTATHQPGQYKY